MSGSSDRSIRLYNPAPSAPLHPPTAFVTKRSAPPAPVPEGRLIQTYAAHGYAVLSLAVAADNARFASAGGDRTVFLWDVATATTLRRFGASGPGGHAGRVNAVAFAGDGDSLVVSGGLDAAVRVWDARAGGPGARPVQALTDARDAVSALAVRGPEILAGSVDGRLRTYDARTGRLVTDVLGASVTSLCLARDGRAVLVGTLDSRLRLLDRDSGACLRTYDAPGRWRNEELRVQSVLGGRERWVVAGDELAGDDAAAAAADGHGRVWAWDLLTGKLAATLAVPWGPEAPEARRRAVGRDGREKERRNVVSSIAWRDDGWGDQFCVGGASGTVTVFGQS